MSNLAPCPLCGERPKTVKEIVSGAVWTVSCESGRVNHSVSVMSWTSAEACAAEWNALATPPTGA